MYNVYFAHQTDAMLIVNDVSVFEFIWSVNRKHNLTWIISLGQACPTCGPIENVLQPKMTFSDFYVLDFRIHTKKKIVLVNWSHLYYIFWNYNFFVTVPHAILGRRAEKLMSESKVTVYSVVHCETFLCGGLAASLLSVYMCNCRY